MDKKYLYIIITPAHNEEKYIKATLNSVIKQTIKPVKWIIINDGSSDLTEEIVFEYQKKYEFIYLVNLAKREERHFGHKVHAFNRGLDEIRDFDYEFIGNLDADISLEAEYYEQILNEFAKDPKLVIAGGMVYTAIEHKYASQKVSLDSVAGAVQLFRRECFEKIGGYQALPKGGIDAAAEIIARMKGWKVCTFPELRALEQRHTGTATDSPLYSRVREGQRLYSIGYGFLFFFLRCVYRSMQRPTILGSVAALIGYLGASFRRSPKALAPEVVQYLRAEQRAKLLRHLWFSN